MTWAGSVDRKRIRDIAIVCAIAAASACLPALAIAAPAPGTPVAVAPGVPSQGRAWELITPADPVSAQLWRFNAIADDGNRSAFETFNPLPGAPSGDLIADIEGMRLGDGWGAAQPSPPYPKEIAVLISDGPVAFSPDLRTSIWKNALADYQPEGQKRGFFRRDADGTYTLLVTVPDQNVSVLIAATSDLSRIFLSSESHLLPGDAARTAGSSIYEVDDAGIRLLDVDDGGSLLFTCGVSSQAVSTDGRRVFFTPSGSCKGQGGVYLREAGATTDIAASQCGLPDCGDDPGVRFLAATSDGRYAFVLAATRLTVEDADPGPDVYRYDAETGQLTLLAGAPGLTPTSGPASAAPGGAAVVLPADDEGGDHGFEIVDAHGSHHLLAGARAFRWSADGRYLVLTTPRQLIAADQDASDDVYRYDTVSGMFQNVSAGLGGRGNGPFAAIGSGSGDIEAPSSRAISADGSRIFFGSAERLVAEDRNDVEDVYEWASGQLGLVSSGAGDRPSTLLSSTPDGGTVVFRTSQTLLPRDRDGGDVDYYAARIGGGFPEPGPPAGCEGAACRPGVPAPAALGAPPGQRGKVELRRPSSADRARFAASGWLSLLAEAPTPGTLSARASARFGSRPRPIGSARTKVDAAGPARLRLRLSETAREALRRGKKLRVQVALRLVGQGDVVRVAFPLGGRS